MRLALWPWFIALTSCWLSQRGDGPAPDDASNAEACAQLSDAWTEASQRCCGGGADSPWVARCDTPVRERFVIDLAAERECFERLQAGWQQCLADVPGRADAPGRSEHPCVRAYRGTQAVGEPCDFDAECAPGLFCPARGAAGTCAQRPDGCSSTGCPADRFCDRDTDECTPLRALGAPCPGGFPNTCAQGYCDDSMCVPALPLGAECSTASPDACGIGAICDETCRPIPAEGEECTATGACLPGLFCVWNRDESDSRSFCQPPFARCSVDADCPSGHCYPEGCAPLPAVLCPPDED